MELSVDVTLVSLLTLSQKTLEMVVTETSSMLLRDTLMDPGQPSDNRFNGLVGEEEAALFAFNRARDLCKKAIANLLDVKGRHLGS